MNKVNRKLEYALIALKHMKSKAPGELSTASEISTQFHTPFDATARVMQILAQKEILRAQQGIHGGYQIIKDLNKVSLYEIMEYVVGPVNLAKCFHEGATTGSCEIKNLCSIVTPMHTLNKKLIEFYRSIKITELLDSRTHTAVSAPTPALQQTQAMEL